MAYAWKFACRYIVTTCGQIHFKNRITSAFRHSAWQIRMRIPDFAYMRIPELVAPGTSSGWNFAYMFISCIVHFTCVPSHSKNQIYHWFFKRAKRSFTCIVGNHLVSRPQSHNHQLIGHPGIFYVRILFTCSPWYRYILDTVRCSCSDSPNLSWYRYNQGYSQANPRHANSHVMSTCNLHDIFSNAYISSTKSRTCLKVWM